MTTGIKRNENASQALRRDIDILAYFVKFSHKHAPFALPMLIMQALTEVATPFINFLLPAAIIDELLGSRDLERLGQLTLMAIGVNLLLYLLQHALARGRQLNIERLYQAQDIALTAKSIAMDYEHVENPKIHELFQLVEEGRRMHGGITSLIGRFGMLIQDVANIIVSASFIIAMLRLPQIGGYSGLIGLIDSPYATLLLLGLLCLGILISTRANEKSATLTRESMESMIKPERRYQYFMFELGQDYRFGKDVRLYHMFDLLRKEYDDFQDRIFERFDRLTKETTQVEMISLAASTLISGVVYLFVAIKALIGAISIGQIVVFVGAINQFNTGLSGLSNHLMDVRMRCRIMEPTRTYLELPPVKVHGSIPVEKRDDDRYEIEFRNVSFRYPGAKDYSLRNVSLKMRIGERMAVVGMNGAGKTTFIKLLCRLYDPSEGEILLNGIDIRKYDYQEYFDLFSVVFQDFKVFAFPVGQNVATSRDYDPQQIMACLDQAGVGERVRNMPQGLDTPLFKKFDEAGVEISGGEAQKIAIARALYKDAPFIILDEPTAALDPISEYEIYARFNEMVGNKTAVYISHRLSSCRFCDDIVVFHAGEIVQRGNHDALLADAEGKYHEMWMAQAQYYRSA